MAPSRASLLLPCLRETEMPPVPLVVCELPVVTLRPALACAFHSTAGGGGAPGLGGSSGLAKTNFGSVSAATGAPTASENPRAASRLARVFRDGDIEAPSFGRAPMYRRPLKTPAAVCALRPGRHACSTTFSQL